MYKKFIIIFIIIFTIIIVNSVNAQNDIKRGETPKETNNRVSLNNPLTGQAKPLEGGIQALIGRVINAVIFEQN